MADEEVQRRHRFNDFTESQQQTLVAAAVPQKTKQATDFWCGVFESFCREKCVSVDVKTISASALADVLKKFYGGLTTKKGATRQPAICQPERPYNGRSLPLTDPTTCESTASSGRATSSSTRFWSTTKWSEAEKTQGRYHRLGQGQTCEVLRRSFGKPGHATASGVLLVQPGTTPGSSRDGGFREDQQA